MTMLNISCGRAEDLPSEQDGRRGAGAHLCVICAIIVTYVYAISQGRIPAWCNVLCRDPLFLPVVCAGPGGFMQHVPCCIVLPGQPG